MGGGQATTCGWLIHAELLTSRQILVMLDYILGPRILRVVDRDLGGPMVG